MARVLRVGIIGVSMERGWAKESHVPAVQKLAGLELAAVATNSQPTANAAAHAFGAAKAYGNGADLIRDPDIDLVSICVRVPAHCELVLKALSVGKHVYCEWPLGKNTAEAEQMQAAADAANVHVAIGLQTRCNPAVRRARELIVSGAIGRVLTARSYSSTVGFGKVTDAAEAYLEQPENGVTLVTIQGGHTIDLAIALLGGLSDVSSLNTTQFPRIRIGDDPATHPRVTPDHMLVQARLASGAALSVEVAGGRPAETPFFLEVVGDEGTLVLQGGAARGFQSGRLQLLLNENAQQVEEGELSSLPHTAANVGGVYAALRDDVGLRSHTVPDFQHAVRLSHLMDTVMLSARDGTRAHKLDWPVQ